MDKQALFERARRLWPNYIDLSHDVLHWRAGGLIEAVNRLYFHDVERRAGQGDPWLEIAAWAFHQSLHSLALEKVENGARTLSPQDVQFSEFDIRMKRNLLHDSWREERAEYATSS